MSLKKILLAAFAVVVVCSGFALPCQAQRTFNRHRPLRWLGQGFSDGYHRHNPGHDTSYYNPYSAHNSSLVSQSPEYLAVIAQQANQQPARRFFAGVPFAVYAAPSQLDAPTQLLHGQNISGTFSPSVGSGLLEQNSEDGIASEDPFQREVENNDNNVHDPDNEIPEEDDGDNDFRESDDEMVDDSDIEMDDMDDDSDGSIKDMDDDSDDMVDEEYIDEDEDNSELGGLSGLNHSLSFDLD